MVSELSGLSGGKRVGIQLPCDLFWSVSLIGVICRASYFVFIHVLDLCFSGGLYSIRFFANPVGT